MNEVIKEYIDTYVKENGNEEITGVILNSTLNEMVSQLYAHRCYGVITPYLPLLYADDIPAWGIASQNGTYTNYGGIEIDDELALIVYDGGVFTKQTIISKSWINNLVNDINNKLIGNSTIKYNAALDVVEIEYANGTVLQVGREQVSFVYNDTESTIVNGTPVYYSGVGGSGVQMPAIAPADATNLATAMVKGHTTIDIPANSYGIIVCKGEMTVESHGLTVGSKIYLGVGGGYVNTPPSNPNLTIELGIVLDADTLHVYPCIISTIFHTDLSNLNSDDNFLHVTSGQVTAWNNKVDGPASSVDNSIPVFDGVTGKLLKGSNFTIDSFVLDGGWNGSIKLQNSTFTYRALSIQTGSYNDEDAIKIGRDAASQHYISFKNDPGGYNNWISFKVWNNLSQRNTVLSLKSPYNSTVGEAHITGKLQVLSGNIIHLAGQMGLGTHNPLSGTKLDVSNGSIALLIGADSNADTRTDATDKVGRLAGAHYTNTEEPIGVFMIQGNQTENILSIGGGSGLLNAATDVKFYTAANTTTVTGTERMRIDNAGKVGIGTNNPTEKLHVIGNIRSSAEVHAGTKVVIASKVEQVYDSVNQSLKFNFL